MMPSPFMNGDHRLGARGRSATSPPDTHSSLREPLLSVDLGSSDRNRDDGTPLNDNVNDATTRSTVSLTQDEKNEPEPKSKNINLILAYTFIAFCSRSLWNQSVLSAFVYLLQTDDPKYVGFITAIMGLAQLLSSFPAGYLADKYRRDTMLRISSIVGVFAAISTAIAAYAEQFWVLAFALAMWGVFWGISFTSISAMFADSIPDGDRSMYFTHRMILQLMGNTFGPTVAYVMFTTLGNVWTMGECARVIQVGQMMSLPALVLLHFIKDDYCIQEMEGGVEQSQSHDVIADHPDIEGVEEIGDIDVEDNTTPLISNDDVSPTDKKSSKFLCIPGRRVVPVLVVTADVLSGLAAGMSVRYFPIFFLENLKMKPDQVQIVFILSMLSMACCTRTVQWVSTKIGRLQTTLIVKYGGISMLFVMIHAFQQEMPYQVVCGLFILRSSLMNAPGALTRSVLMDHVPKDERAKWSSLESVNMFSWAGSAALGGLLVDAKGILFNFTTTARCQIIATLPLILILVFGTVQTEDELGGSESETEDESDDSDDNGDSNSNGNRNDSDSENEND